MSATAGVYVVAGVGPGLGSAVASLLASAGHTTIGISRQAGHLARLEQSARAQGWSFVGLTADLTLQSDVDSAVRNVLERFGRIDGVAVTAGRWILGSSLVHEIREAEWTDGIDANLRPLLCVARATVPPMVQRHQGSIVVVAAAEAVRWAGSASYAAAKGGLIDLVRKMARDYRPLGIRVNAVLPGNMAREVDPSAPPNAEGAVPLRDDTPTSPWEVARIIALLLSHQSRWITGTTVTVDGGRSTWGEEQG